MLRVKSIFLILVSLFIMYSCSNKETKTHKENKESIDKALEVDDELVDEFNEAKQVFYALPSPVETAMLIKRAGAEYDMSFLNSSENLQNYNTTFSKALNFGVYGADLCYSSLFSQIQTTIQYMSISKQLADDLGILGFVDNDIVGRLESNVNNRDSSMLIITDGFMTSNEYLRESGRPEVAALIIAGGWIEGLFLAVSLTRNSPNNNELIDRIIDQKLSIFTLISLLEKYSDNKDVAIVLGLLKEIYTVYDKIQIITSKVEPLTDNETKVTTLQAKSDVFISDEVFEELCLKIDSIRTIVVSDY